MPRRTNLSADNIPPRGTALKVQQWAADGYTKRGVAKSLGVSLDTLNAWMDRHPRIRASAMLGTQAAKRNTRRSTASGWNRSRRGT